MTDDFEARVEAQLLRAGEPRALVTPTPSSNMSVTPLEWNGNSGRAVMGSYRVSYNVSGQPWGYPERGAGFYAERDIGLGQLVSGPHETRKEAEQSADLDYERHILSALSATAMGPTPAPILGDEDRKAVSLGAAVLARIEDPAMREIAIRNALAAAVASAKEAE